MDEGGCTGSWGAKLDWGAKEKLVENYTIIDYSRKPPFIIDPHGESHRMLPRLLGDNMAIVDLIKPNIAEGIKEAVEQGKTLIIDNVSAPPPLCVTQLVKPKFVHDDEKKYLQVESHLLECHPHFRVYLRSDRLDKFTVDFLKNPPFIIDPHGESHRMLPRLLGDNMAIVDLIKPNIAEGIKEAVEQGKTLIIDNVSAPPPLCVTQLVKPKFVHDDEKKYLQVESHLLECHPHFRVYLRSDRLDKFTVDFLKN
uniref:Metal-dependent hydrolase n=1 Tax=Bursaphelenchus xylophilus TaxID=6326 RepID=A0A1I7SN01_BURXY